MNLEKHEIIGEVLEKPGEVQYEWSIQNFFSLLQTVDLSYRSSEFLFHDACWNLVISPNGSTAQETEGWICLYVMRLDFGPPRTVSYRLGLRKVNGKEIVFKEKDSCTFFKMGNHGWGEPHFLYRRDLMQLKSELAPLDTLTVTCTLKNEESHTANVSLFRRLWNLSGDMQAILSEGERCDIKLDMKDGEIAAHRLILGKRSEVFQRMLKSDMRENRTGEVSVEDGNEELLRVFLNYVYSGDPRGLTQENVCEVFKIAHKYCAEELMKFCAVCMQECLSVDIFCDVIGVVELYEEKKLKECVKDYFIKNVSEIMKSEEWDALKREKPTVVSELLECVAVRNVSKMNV